MRYGRARVSIGLQPAGENPGAWETRRGHAPLLIRLPTLATSVGCPSYPLSAMPLSPVQITAANEVIDILCSASAGPRAKRKLGDMFLDLVDKDDLPEYYEV